MTDLRSPGTTLRFAALRLLGPGGVRTAAERAGAGPGRRGSPPSRVPRRGARRASALVAGR